MGKGSEWVELEKELGRQGYSIRRTGRGPHRGIFTPDGKRVFSLPGTPSDVRAFRNMVSDLRRAIGFRLPGRSR